MAGRRIAKMVKRSRGFVVCFLVGRVFQDYYRADDEVTEMEFKTASLTN